MLKGNTVTLRTVSESDLEKLYAFHLDIANRGDFFPARHVPAEVPRSSGRPVLDQDEDVVILDKREIIGHVEFYKTVNYLDEYELSYILYSGEHRGKGAMTEAVTITVRYLFETKPLNRLRLVIHPSNAASRRLAENCGFRHEGTARGAWYNKGRHHDVEIYPSFTMR
jgi:RimJ/RimL family protein N-acetyltransferase